MGYRPTDIAAANRNIARAPGIGLEYSVELSPDPVLRHAEIKITDVGTYDPIDVDAVNDLALSGSPADLVVAVRNEFESAVQGVLVLSVIDADGATVAATATLSPSQWWKNQDYGFAPGTAFDLVTANGKKVKKLLSVTSLTGGKAGSRLRILQLPATSSFKFVGCTTNKDFTTPARESVSIACEEEAAQFVKAGRGAVPMLTVTSKLASMGDGLARYSGRFCTGRVIVEKAQKVISEVHYFGNWFPKAKPNVGDGNDEATVVAEGSYQDYAAFYAK